MILVVSFSKYFTIMKGFKNWHRFRFAPVVLEFRTILRKVQ